MSYELDDLGSVNPLGVFTNARPFQAEFTCSSADSRSFVIATTISAATGAGPTYANATVETTWDDGVTWEPVTGVETQAIDATTGTFLVYATLVMSPVSPRCRITWTPVAAHTITISDFKKSRHAPGDTPISTPPNTSAGATTVTISSPLGAQAEATSVAVALATDQATQTAPLGVRETNGTDWLGTLALAAAQLTTGAITAIKAVASVAMGWDGADHREIAVNTSGHVLVDIQDAKTVAETAYNDYASTNVTTGAWVELVAATSADITEIEIFDSSGRLLELGVGAAAAETRKILVIPGGNGLIPIDIPSGTRLSLRAVDANATAGFIACNLWEG